MNFRERYRKYQEAEGRGFAGPGEFFDADTFQGLLRLFVAGGVGLYVLWHSYELAAWFKETVFGLAPTDIDPAKQSWARLWAVIIGGSAMVVSGLAMVKLFFKRCQIRKNVDGE
jgi:hypothetical protein